MTKHIVCYSGGHSSGIVGIEVARFYGIENTVLLNHNIHPNSEAVDIKRFKQEVADYLKIPITYANHPEWETKDQFDVVIDAKAFKVGNGTALCTHRLKTEPFQRWLEENAIRNKDIIYYGFDAYEGVRIQRRASILANMGYRTDFPLAMPNWFMRRTLSSTRQIGIEPPNTYSVFKHANCTGCLKAGKQHWYIVYCTRPDIWDKAVTAEQEIGYSILSGVYLDELEETFEKLRLLGVTTTEHEGGPTFFARVRKIFRDIESDEDNKPCECIF